MHISNAVRTGIAASLLLAAVVTGCSSTVDGAATCPGCGSGTEPEFPTSRPTTSSPASTMPTPVPVSPSEGGEVLPPSDTGYVYIETKSGKTRCQISADSVGCESDFTDPPTVNGEPATGVEVSAAGDHRWHGGNLGAMPTTTIDYTVYQAVGWTIDASFDGTRFTNDDTGHGMFISTGGVEFF